MDALPVVIDSGSGVTKAGFAGSDAPRVKMRSYVGRLKHKRVIPGGALDSMKDDSFVGVRADEHKGVLLLSYPMENGVVKNWGDMEKIWSYIYSRENLNVRSEDHAVLLTEAPLNPTSQRAKAAELFFEGMNAPALYFSMQAILSLYASGRTSGVVLDSGDGVSHSVPVYEGFALPHAISRVDFAGKDVTTYLKLLLRKSGYNFNTSAELETVRHMKEECCVVAANIEGKKSDETYNYQLPDGQTVTIGSEAYRAPEVLFQPRIVGNECLSVHDCLAQSIMKADLDVRRLLFGQIVLAGGSTLFPGFGNRILKELKSHPLTPAQTKIRVAAPPERIHSTWIGGSILASLTTFQSMYTSRAEYLENGYRCLDHMIE